VGIDTQRLHPLCFAGGLALAGVVGALLSMIYEIAPSIGESYTVTALIVITLGGLGNIVGSLAGALILGMVESFGMYLTSPSLKSLLSYGVFVLVMLIRPKGLLAR
jgi:branched-chain amino acid transport system permease protein